MPRRPAHTLLLLTAQRLVRADLARGPLPALLGLWLQARPLVDDLPSLVELALQPGGRPGRRVWVLSSDLWTQTVSLGSGATSGMAAEDLQRALSFEVEALSGLSAFDSVLGVRGLPAQDGMRQFWVTQMTAAQREQIEDVIRRAGGRLAGLCHPGGLPVPLVDGLAPEVVWQRLELWSDTVISVHNDPAYGLQVQILNADPRLGRWQAPLAQWQAGLRPVEYREVLTASSTSLPPDLEAPRLAALDDEAALATWLSAWGRQLATAPTQVPLLRPLLRQWSASRRAAVAAGLWLCTLGACGGHYLWTTQQRQSLQAALQRLQEPAKQASSLEQQASKLEKELATGREQLQALQYDVQLTSSGLSAQRQRLARLLRALAEHRPAALLLQKIDSRGGDLTLHGLSLQPELANQFATALAAQLQGYGWRVQAPTKEGKNLLRDGGPWGFMLHLVDVDMAPTPPPPPAPARRAAPGRRAAR
ncbi:MAG: hypothetical protein AB7N91_04160 [Candidatus Tectimicrobiota bacterium]